MKKKVKEEAAKLKALEARIGGKIELEVEGREKITFRTTKSPVLSTQACIWPDILSIGVLPCAWFAKTTTKKRTTATVSTTTAQK